jgi:CheY-like chemotaxis protein
MDGGATCIVVVEDDPSINLLITRILQRGGYRVASATSSREAVRLVQQLRPAVLVTEVALETYDAGLELVWWLRQNPATATIGVVFCSGELEARQLGRAQGARERCVYKPFLAAELLASVRALLAEGA